MTAPGDRLQMPNGTHYWNGERWVPPSEVEHVGDRIEIPAPQPATLP